MIPDMPKPRPPYLQHEITRHGKTVWYVRTDREKPRIRIRAPYGTPEFMAEYQAAVSGVTPAEKRTGGKGTLGWALNLYRKSSAWLVFSMATRRQRENILKHVLASAAAVPLANFTRATIVAGRDRRAKTPAAARHFIETMRGFFKWAVEAELIAVDPTQGVQAPKMRTEGHLPWGDADIAAYEAKWPRGTRERVAFDILLYTGLRRGDAVVLGRQHLKAGVARIKTEKTAEWVAIPIALELQATLDAGPCGDLTFIAGERGARRVKESFGEWFRTACRAAGVSKSAHGLRKAAATRAANNGASERELEAMFGWRGGRMAALYTRSADRERLALGAASKLHQRNDR